VICAAVRQLGGGDVNNPFARLWRDHLNISRQVLVGVAESHPAAYAGLKIGCTARKIIGSHALVRVPGIDHPLKPRIRVGEGDHRELTLPVFHKCREGGINLFHGVIPPGHCLRPCLVYDLRGDELFTVWVFNITQHKDIFLHLTRLKVCNEAV